LKLVLNGGKALQPDLRQDLRRTLVDRTEVAHARSEEGDSPAAA